MTRVLKQSLMFCLISAVAPCLSAAPNIASVSNAASNISPGLPNAPIAQGAIFVVYGSGLGPANIAFASTAFQSTTVSGTSVSVTVSGTTVAAPLYYSSATQVAALLPSNTPTGNGTITVTYNNQPSNSAPITVVTRNWESSRSIPAAADPASSLTPITASSRPPRPRTAADRTPPVGQPIPATR